MAADGDDIVEIDTVITLCDQILAERLEEETTLTQGTVSDVVVDKFCQAREDNYLEKSIDQFDNVVASQGTNDDALIGAQQSNALLAGFQTTYLQRKKSRMERLNSKASTMAQDVDEHGVWAKQLKNVGTIMDPFYITNLIRAGQEGES